MDTSGLPSNGTGQESALLERLQNGDHHAFEQVYGMYRSRLYRTAFRIVRQAQDAEDAVQDTLMRAFVKINTFDGRCHLYTWLTSILVNCCLIQLRKRKRQPLLRLDEPEDFGNSWTDIPAANVVEADEALIADEQISTLRAAVQRMRPDLRYILTARNEAQLPIAEIASRLGLSVPTTKSRALRARTICIRKVRLLLKSGKKVRPLGRSVHGLSAGVCSYRQLDSPRNME